MRRIGVKLWLGMMILVGVMLLLLWLFQIVFLERLYTDMQLNRIAEKASSWGETLGSLDHLDGIGQDAALATELEDFAYSQQFDMQILDDNGDPVFQVFSTVAGNLTSLTGPATEAPTGSSGTSGSTNGNGNGNGSSGGNSSMRGATLSRWSVTDIVQDVYSGKVVKTSYEHPRFGDDYWVVATPIYETGTDQIEGAVVLSASLVPVAEAADILKQQLLYIILIMLVVSLLLSWRISLHFSRPIEAIGKTAKAISKGDYQARVQTTVKDEIGQLAQDINVMGENLEHTESLRRELIGNVSHELRTPLSLIRGYAETLRDVTGNSPEKRERQLGIIIDESDRLSRMIEEILNLSRLESDRATYDREPVDLCALAHRVADKFENLCLSKNIVLHVQSEGKAMVRGDAFKLEQVIYNFVGNAVLHGENATQIDIRCKKQDGHWHVSVSDDGVGIPKEIQANLWERFYRGERKSKSGTGLGLSIAAAILKAHGATYGIDGDVGLGTTFWFDIPETNS
ncbi:MAG: hypothetical protein PWQ12_319 [Clostridiales bacterium]|jgi:signal transduction histidine kinase|nr:hypothetical protein [Clostridiales bacterium]